MPIAKLNIFNFLILILSFKKDGAKTKEQTDAGTDPNVKKVNKDPATSFENKIYIKYLK